MKKIRLIILLSLITLSAFPQSTEFKDLVILKDGTVINGVQTTITKDSLIVTKPDRTETAYEKKEIAEVKKKPFDASKGFRDTVTLKDGTVIEPAQTLVNRDTLIVFTEDGTATIYPKKDVSGVTKGKPASAGSGNFSAYQGKMNWEDAKEKCASIGMRLPTIGELKAAYAAKVTEPWKTDGVYYWSSTPVGDDRAYGLGIGYGFSGDRYRDLNGYVRCLR